ncbi:AMP-binding protein [Agrobacterium larrymoorei]|uniref:AMP-binding protein n=1 Tax=Agrobacterium larrymoorei TaxID=160699 RepID=UPI001F2DBF9A|nr:AMP-binding protein [Agrobacterium larrymoorei]
MQYAFMHDRAVHQAGKAVSEDPLRYRATVAPGRAAVLEIASGLSLTFEQFDHYVARTAAVISRLNRGDDDLPRIAFLGRNSIAQLGLCFACQRIGAVFVPLNWRLSAAELIDIIEDCAPALLVYAAEFESVIPASKDGTHFMPLDGDSGLEAAIETASPIAPVYRGADTPCIMLYTSGTTGTPKGVVLSSANVFFSSLNFSFVGEVGPQSVILCDLPFFHIIGLVALARTAMLMGARLIISDRFQADRTLATLADTALGVTHYCGVPQVAQALRNAPGWDAKALRGLKAMFIGGAPSPPVLIEAYLNDGIPLVNGYGMSEAGTVCHMPLDPTVIAAHQGSIGFPVPLMELKIANPEGDEVADGATGEIWLRGPSVMSGYWNKPVETAAVLVDGWYRTGDLAYRKAGVIYLADRLKDMYISGGENVYPAEVEAAIATHPGVRDVAVIGIPDAVWGDAGLAVIVPADPAPDASEIIAHCATRLARYKRPGRILFVDNIPRTASGKAQKHILRQTLGSHSE